MRCDFVVVVVSFHSSQEKPFAWHWHTTRETYGTCWRNVVKNNKPRGSGIPPLSLSVALTCITYLHIDSCSETRNVALFHKSCLNFDWWKCHKSNNCWRCRIFLLTKRITVSRYFCPISSFYWLISEGTFESWPSKVCNRKASPDTLSRQFLNCSVRSVLRCEGLRTRDFAKASDCFSDNDTTINKLKRPFWKVNRKGFDASNSFYSRPVWKYSFTTMAITTRALI